MKKSSGFLNAGFLFLLACSTLTAFTFQMITPVLTKYISGSGYTLAAAGTVSGLYSIAALVGRPFSGMLSGRFNMKYLAIPGLALTTAGTVGLALTGNLIILGACRIIQGLGFSLSSTVLVAMATSYMPEDRIGEGVGYFALSNLLAMSAGPGLGLALSDRGGYQILFLTAGACTLIPAVGLCFLKFRQEITATEKAKLSVREFFAPELLPYLLFTAVFSMSTSLISSYLSLLSESRNIADYSWYFTISAVVMLLSRPLAGRLSDRRGGKFVIFPAYLLCALALFLIAGAASCRILFAAAVVNAFGSGAGSPACQSECIRIAGSDRRGLAVSMYYIGADLANGLGPSIGGAIADSCGYAAMYRTMAVVCLLTAACFHLYTRFRTRRRTG